MAEVNIGEILKTEVQSRLREFGIKTTIAAKNIGYELRCADPIPFDMEYTRDLGYSAATYLIGGGSSAMISMQGGQLVPIPFDSMINPETGRTRVRSVDVGRKPGSARQCVSHSGGKFVGINRLDHDSLAAARRATGNGESRSGQIECLGQEAEQGGVCRAIDRRRCQANAERAIR